MYDVLFLIYYHKTDYLYTKVIVLSYMKQI